MIRPTLHTSYCEEKTNLWHRAKIIMMEPLLRAIREGFIAERPGYGIGDCFSISLMLLWHSERAKISYIRHGFTANWPYMRCMRISVLFVKLTRRRILRGSRN